MCCIDVGGGAVVNETRHALARIPLRWMIRQCFLLNTGILFHASSLKLMGLEPSTLYPKVQYPRPPPVTELSKEPIKKRNLLHQEAKDFVSEEEEDLADILTDKLDMLKCTWAWWVLEYLPQKIRYQGDDNKWTRKYA
jgi:hypothetical protein